MKTKIREFCTWTSGAIFVVFMMVALIFALPFCFVAGILTGEDDSGEAGI